MAPSACCPAGARRDFKEGFRFGEVPTDVEPDRPDDEAEQKGHAPAPAFECLGRKRSRQEGAEKRSNEHREPLADHLPGSVKTAPVRRSAFDQERGRARELTSGGKTLQQACQHDEQRCC